MLKTGHNPQGLQYLPVECGPRPGSAEVLGACDSGGAEPGRLTTSPGSTACPHLHQQMMVTRTKGHQPCAQGPSFMPALSLPFEGVPSPATRPRDLPAASLHLVCPCWTHQAALAHPGHQNRSHCSPASHLTLWTLSQPLSVSGVVPEIPAPLSGRALAPQPLKGF